jgi:hypothetical protein
MVVDGFGRVSRAVQTGDGQRYMAVFAIGAAALIFFATRPVMFGELRVNVTGRSIDVDVRRGGTQPPRQLIYSFDFDDDGKVDVKGANARAQYAYPKPGEYTIRVNVSDPRWGTDKDLKQKVVVR